MTSTVITTRDWDDYQYMRQLDDQGADDFRYVIKANPEPDQPSDMYSVEIFDWKTGASLERFTTDDPGRDVEASREAQEFDFEERMERAYERECDYRLNGGW
jgi:hypothetical protein